jgi:hypothetical protein
MVPEGNMSLKDRLQLEYEILERIDQVRDGESTSEVSEELERAIIERELAELEKHSHIQEGREVLVRLRKRPA